MNTRETGTETLRMSRRRRAKGGFSLPEILVAIVIGAGLVVAAMTFAFSMGELWGNGSEARLFDQHVRGVTRFLENVLQQARPPPVEAESSIQAGSAQTAEQSIVWQAPRGRPGAGVRDQLLTFELPESPGVFAWPERPLPFVVCALRVDPREGLFLQWKSRLEIDFADTAPREMRLSPFVTGLTYYYYDDDENNPSWEERSDPKQTTPQVLEVPRRIRLTFTYEDVTREVNLMLPGVANGVPVY
ncbi:hypothetical protein ASA1KI_03070 [Opitutales bacterium ASA1]|uniref:PulJ/GspJ family protein n=1 Tax=Congregicoccus parvus TaxID=3081749 RepID=UPI002B30DC8F|nr:hypothetical protein ASA1KI_03070 [Opitutales bacterium ASA1]